VAKFATHTYKQGVQVLLAACDEALLGQTFSEGKLQLEVRPTFYDGQRLDADELGSQMGRCTMGNLVGEETVALAIKLGLVLADNVMHIDGVPHAQFMVMDS